MSDEPLPKGVLVGLDGQVLPPRATTPCPKCGAPPSDRVASCGMGRTVGQVCRKCGNEDF